MRFTDTKDAVLNREAKAPYLTFPVLSKIPYIRHGFSTRLGGVSKGFLSSMNLDFSREDRSNVVKNYQLICESIGLNKNDLVLSQQVHDTKIRVVSSADKGKGIIKERDYKGIDGLITNVTGIPLATFYADCVPLYFVDTKNQAIGLSHSGWRGTVNRMGEVTLKAMNDNFGTSTEDVIALIGPSICQDCYEVSKDVADAFYGNFRKEQWDEILFKKEDGKYQLDLWKANYHIFLDSGVKSENIHISKVCTSCNKELLFSHRATNGERGSLGAFLMLTNDLDKQ
jgi:purine-nucleoside/S-methyl-5'-thioadenosine phosphorylase / adenosine deaminase